MNLETLQSFCQDDPTRSLGRPWTKDGFTYASEGFVLVRVPALEADPGGKGVAVEKIYELAGPMPETGWIDFPAIPAPELCPKCKNGELPQECPECDGSGEVTLSNSYSTYECECQSCDGSGKGDECPTCNGVGFVDPSEFIHIEGVKFKTWQIRRLSTLSGCQIAPTKEKIAWIRFDGGDALLMPIIDAH